VTQDGAFIIHGKFDFRAIVDEVLVQTESLQTYSQGFARTHRVL